MADDISLLALKENRLRIRNTHFHDAGLGCTIDIGHRRFLNRIRLNGLQVFVGPTLRPKS
jgi:hypothetical protein